MRSSDIEFLSVFYRISMPVH